MSQWRRRAASRHVAALRWPALSRTVALLLATSTLLPPAFAAPRLARPAEAGSLHGKSLLRRTGGDFKVFFRGPFHRGRHHWKLFGLALAGIAVAARLDHEARETAQRKRTDATNDDSHFVRPLGEIVPIAGFAASWIAGEIRHDDDLTSTGIDGLEASLLAAGLVTPAMKLALGRSRPDRDEGPLSFHPFSGNSSFPAGEPTEAFTSAMVLSKHTRHRWVKVSAWSAAGLVGLERMNFDRHWLSDVVAAGVIGSGIADFIVRRHDRPGPAVSPLPASRKLRAGFTPLVLPDGRGFMVRLSF